MGAAYAVLGLVVGIIMDEAIRRRVRNSPKRSGLQPRPCQSQDLATRDSERAHPVPRLSRRFLAQDYYDR